MACDAQTLASLAATNKASSLSHRGLAEALAAQAAQHGDSAFSPSSIAGLSLWLDAQGSVTAPGGHVSSWADKSGNANNAVYSGAGGATAPLYSGADARMNGKPSLDFSAAAALLCGSVTNYPFHIFAVCYQTAGAGITNNSLISSSDPTTFYGYVAGVEDSLSWYATGSTDTPVNGVVNGVASVLQVYGDGVLPFTFRQNATLLGSPPSNIALTTGLANAPIIVGAFDNTGQFGFNGAIGEIIVYNSVLSDSDRGKVETYLSAKWALGF